MSVSKVMRKGVQFCTPVPTNSPKNPKQKWVKWCMETPMRQVVLQTSLFIVQLSAR